MLERDERLRLLRDVVLEDGADWGLPELLMGHDLCTRGGGLMVVGGGGLQDLHPHWEGPMLWLSATHPHCRPPNVVGGWALGTPKREGGGVLARGNGVGLFAVGGAYWPLALAHSDPLWVRTCFGRVNEGPG